ncbi:DUF1822 family protein [Leptothoe sp. EHU-05/26/07-4]
MSYMQQSGNAASLIWPITQQGKRIAQQFAQEHTQARISERVRRNTLAVWVMHDFLSALGVPTDLNHSDSWNPVLQLTEDVADLVIPRVGRLECRPVLSGDITLPLEVLTERIGYVAVALDEVAGEASLLGFGTEVSSTYPYLRLAQLRSMDDLPVHLDQIGQSQSGQLSSQLTCLGQWLEGQVEDGWQLAEDLLAQYLWVPAFRQGGQTAQRETPVQVKRAKLLDLNLTLGTEQVALVLDVQQESATVVNIAMRLYPMGENVYLPQGLIVTVLDEAGTVCLTAQARSVDNYLQLYFRGCPGEPFTIRIDLDDASVVENFLI